MSFTIQLLILRNKLKNMRISNFKGFKGFCLVSLSALLLNSCYNEPQFLGNNLIPDDDKYAVKIDTLFELSAYTIKPSSDTIIYPSGVFGYVSSEIFGSTKGSFVGRFITAESNDGFGGTTAKPDSLFFYFKPYLPYYGDSSKVLNIKIYELTDTSLLWKPDVLRNIEGKYNPTPFISTTFKGGQKSLKIPIDTSYARQLMDSLAITNYKLFYTKFKGFFVTCDDLSGYEIAYKVDASSFSFLLYYHYTKVINEKDSLFKKIMSFNFNTWRYFKYDNDFSKANPAKEIRYLNDSTIQDSVFYSQGLSGAYGKIQLDGVTQWLDSTPIIIHKAELIIGKNTPETTTPDSIVETLALRYKIDGNWAFYNNDFLIYKGNLKLYSNNYSINITSLLQRVLEGEIKDKNLYVFPINNNEVSRVVLHSGSNNSKKMKLRLTYTKLR